MKKLIITTLIITTIGTASAHDRNGNPTINDAMFAAEQANNNAHTAQQSANRALGIIFVVVVVASVVGAQIYASNHNPGQIRLAQF